MGKLAGRGVGSVRIWDFYWFSLGGKIEVTVLCCRLRYRCGFRRGTVIDHSEVKEGIL